MDKKKKNDTILICVLAAAAVILFIYLRVVRPHMSGLNSGLTAEITVDNEVVFSEDIGSLELPFTYEVKAKDGGCNTFVIDKDEKGVIGMSCTHADCPDKVCVETGRVTLPDDPIVCLPHKTVARLYRTSE
ncbi:MAG: NusG domain II-containing protein [Lachnospiraceae bacterium]|nr:NusG domain II-containing protein [Lachnospiraceae bacterium]